jgi:tRNA threonylcarbamoyladenosine biosynthesis protein TsaB
LDFPAAPPKLPVAMACLAQLLAVHGSILVFDAVSLRVQIGLLRAGQLPIWERTNDEAGRGLFSGAENALTKAGMRIGDVEAFVFCEGPGSMLGTRTVAMALRTWLTLRPRPVFTYQSLMLAALAEWRRAPRSFSVVADARRENWHVQPIATDGTLGSLHRCPATELPGGELLTPAGFRVWSKPPVGVSECNYDLESLIGAADAADLFQPVTAPDVLQHEAPDYKKWSAQPHSAETAIRK